MLLKFKHIRSREAINRQMMMKFNDILAQYCKEVTGKPTIAWAVSTRPQPSLETFLSKEHQQGVTSKRGLWISNNSIESVYAGCAVCYFNACSLEFLEENRWRAQERKNIAPGGPQSLSCPRALPCLALICIPCKIPSST